MCIYAYIRIVYDIYLYRRGVDVKLEAYKVRWTCCIVWYNRLGVIGVYVYCVRQYFKFSIYYRAESIYYRTMTHR